MTSSLVGSEMCIRDSTRTKERKMYICNNPNDIMLTIRPGAKSVHVLQLCLLYTSDAADDM
eukprot:1232962-Prorocentrum_lima.AAC.1